MNDNNRTLRFEFRVCVCVGKMCKLCRSLFEYPELHNSQNRNFERPFCPSSEIRILTPVLHPIRPSTMADDPDEHPTTPPPAPPPALPPEEGRTSPATQPERKAAPLRDDTHQLDDKKTPKRPPRSINKPLPTTNGNGGIHFRRAQATQTQRRLHTSTAYQRHPRGRPTAGSFRRHRHPDGR